MVAAGAGLAVMDPFTAAARADRTCAVRPLVEKVVLRYGLLTLRERPLAGEVAGLAQGIHDEVRKSIKALQVGK
jgi:hypothetical protein